MLESQLHTTHDGPGSWIGAKVEAWAKRSGGKVRIEALVLLEGIEVLPGQVHP